MSSSTITTLEKPALAVSTGNLIFDMFPAIGPQVKSLSQARKAFEQAHLDWDLAEGQSGCQFPYKGKDIFLPIEGASREIVRVDFKRMLNKKPEPYCHLQPLGRVTGRYESFDNEKLYRLGIALAKDRSGEPLILETCGMFEKGKRVWLLFRFPQGMRIGGDKIYSYLLLTTRHDGKGAVRALLTNIRVVCKNTLIMALKAAERVFSLRHVPYQMTEEEVQAAVSETLGLANDYEKAFRNESKELLNQRISKAAAERFINSFLFPDPEPSEFKGQQQRLQTMVDEKRALLWMELNAEDLQNVQNTGWWLFNAVAAADKDGKLYNPQAKESRRRLELNFERSFEGPRDNERDYKALTLEWLHDQRNN